MKYWENMLKGSKLRPQCFASMFNGVGSCAIGALYEGIFGTKALTAYSAAAWSLVNDLNDRFGIKSCPVCKVEYNFGTTLWHLNDAHSWSRENIAYYLRSIEEPNYKHAEEKVNELVGA